MDKLRLTSAPRRLALLLAAASLGCGNGPIEVVGDVTLDDQPLRGGTIIFVGLDDATAGGSGPISKSGRYRAVLNKPGRMKVYLEPPVSMEDAMSKHHNQNPDIKDKMSRHKEGKQGLAKPIPESCRKPGTTELRAEIGKGKQTRDFALRTPTDDKPDADK